MVAEVHLSVQEGRGREHQQLRDQKPHAIGTTWACSTCNMQEIQNCESNFLYHFAMLPWHNLDLYDMSVIICRCDLPRPDHTSFVCTAQEQLRRLKCNKRQTNLSQFHLSRIILRAFLLRNFSLAGRRNCPTRTRYTSAGLINISGLFAANSRCSSLFRCHGGQAVRN